jgi:hypothetical protein
MKKNEIVSLAGKWMGQEMIILNEIIQSHIDKYHVFFPICVLQGEQKYMKLRGEVLGMWKDKE